MPCKALSTIITNKLTEPYFNNREDIVPFFESELEAIGVDYFDFYLMHEMTAENYKKYKLFSAFETLKEDYKMACFIVPAAEAIITTIAKKNIDKCDKYEKNLFVRRMNWLNNMLWGGSALLAFEHIWHGEVTPWFPFLTNAANREDAVEMLREIATSGVAMASLVTSVWVGMVVVSGMIEKRHYTSKSKV